MAFIEDGNKYEADQILSGTSHKIMELEVPMGKKVTRGDVVNSSCELTSDGSDVFGVVLETVDGTKVKTKTTVVIFGEVIGEFLNFSGTLDKTFIDNLRSYGLIVKKLGGKE